MPQFQNFTAEDKIIETVIVTKGFFTGDVGSVAGSTLTTSSLTASQQPYYANLANSSVDHFSVTFGHKNGSGSLDETDVGKTKAVYQQMATTLLFPDEIENTGFQFDGSTTEESVWFLLANRERFKDRINIKNWTLNLSGSSGTQGTGATNLALTDDSADVAPTATPVGSRYNIVAGTAGVVTTPATTKNYGWFYPDLGVFALAGSQISASIPGVYRASGDAGYEGHSTGSHMGSGLDSSSGFHTDLHASAKNHLKLVEAINRGTGITMRNEERQITTSYFVRVKANQFNCSNNPTYSSESRNDNSYAIKEFTGNPRTFITEVGLYNGSNKLVAVGKLSAAVEKSFEDETYLKLKLVY